MPGGRRGLLAPQNTFLDAIIKKANEQNSSFLIANARVVDFPLVYCNELFCKQVGYIRSEITQRSANLKFLQGDLTEAPIMDRLQNSLDQQIAGTFELILYKRNKITPMWFFINLVPITNEKNEAVLYLMTFKDITSMKLPAGVEISRFKSIVRLARTVTRSKSFIKNPASSPQASAKQQLGSLEAVPRYMLEPPKTPPRIILHYSALKTTWDWTILVLTFYTAIMVPYKLTFLKDVTRNLQNQNQLLLFATDTLIDVAFFIDVLLNFHTTYVGCMEEVISDPKLIRWNYLKGWFVIDMLSCVPYDVFDLIAFSSQQNSGKSTGVADAFSTLKIIRLSVRVWRVARKRDHYLEYGGAQLIIFMCGFLLAAHWFACGWYIIGHYEIQKKYGWLEQLSVDMSEDFNVNPSKIHADDIWTVYVSSLYYTISSMTSIGFGNISANTSTEKVFTIVMMIVGALLYAAIFGNVTTIVQQLYSSSARYHEMLNNIREFMKLHQVPKELSERVMDYVVSSWASSKGINSEKVLTYCPKDMKADLCVHMNRQILKQHRAFKVASEGCLRALAVNFEMAHSAPGDLIYHTGESLDYLCFIVAGSLEVLQDEEVVALLGVGDVFGDMFWKETSVGQSTANVRALTYCDVHMIRRENLLEVLSFYSNFSAAFARNINITYNLRYRKRVRKIIDFKRELEEEEKRKNEPHQDIPADHPVRRLFSKFKKAESDGNDDRSPSPDNRTTIDSPTDSDVVKPMRSTWDKFFDRSREKPSNCKLSNSGNFKFDNKSVSTNSGDTLTQLFHVKQSMATDFENLQAKLERFDTLFTHLFENSAKVESNSSSLSSSTSSSRMLCSDDMKQLIEVETISVHL